MTDLKYQYLLQVHCSKKFSGFSWLLTGQPDPLEPRESDPFEGPQLLEPRMPTVVIKTWHGPWQGRQGSWSRQLLRSLPPVCRAALPL